MAAAPLAWAHRLACLTTGATLVLLVAGGLVTSTGAALAVPDWPTTFGRNLFLFPWSGMVGGVFYEHSHRLLGAAVGALTVGLAALLWATDRRGWVRGLGLLAVAVVSIQGLLGGLRVLWLRESLAIVHGCLAQAFLALVVALAVVTSRDWTVAGRAPGDWRATGRLALAVVAVLYGQIVLGALTVHHRWPGWVVLHLAGAAVATGVALALALHVRRRHAGEPALGRPGGILAALAGLQVALGLGAYIARFTGLAVPGGAPVALVLPVAHRATGAILLGVAVVLALRSVRRWHGAVAPPEPGRVAPLARGVAA
jgi:cytochrome c oxidase assembly protein subunit 15